jgi:hypothetical protein
MPADQAAFTRPHIPGEPVTAKWTLTFDCARPTAQAAFWRLALGYVDAGPPKGFDSWDAWYRAFDIPEEGRDDVAALEDPNGIGPKISFLKVPESKVAKNRIHLDIQIGGGRSEPLEMRWPKVTAMVERLTSAGATVLCRDMLDDGRPDHVVMADPEGNEFCVL